MRNRLIAVFAVVLMAVAVTAMGYAGSTQTTKLSASLDTKQEVPKPSATTGKGTFTGTVSGTKLRWKMTFSKLTGAAAAAHIHLAKRGKANPAPAVALCGPCKSGKSGTASVPASVLRKIKAGGAYVNVHTAKNPGGEIRGQIKAG
jgi:Cu/Zn superoxide dismutase